MRSDGLASLDTEQELLVRAARTEDVDVERVRTLAASDVDWPRLQELATANGVAPLVSQTLSRDCADVVDEDALGTFQHYARRTATSNLQFAQELPRVMNALVSAGVDALTYRGAVLANDGYDDLGMRQFGDIDLLLRREDIPRAKAVLEELGYRPAYQRESVEELSSGQSWAYRRLCRDYAFVNDETNTEVELHWRVIGLQFPTNIQLDDLWTRRTTTEIGGESIAVPAPEDRLLAMCVHATRHRWERLTWICDVDEFCRRHEIEWSATLQRAREHQAERMFLLGPALAHELFGTEIPPLIERAIEDDETLQRLRSEVVLDLFDTSDLFDLDLVRYQARSLERRRDRARVFLSWMFKPRRIEIEMLALPIALAWVYFLVRPLRLGKTILQHLLPSSGAD